MAEKEAHEAICDGGEEAWDEISEGGSSGSDRDRVQRQGQGQNSATAAARQGGETSGMARKGQGQRQISETAPVAGTATEVASEETRATIAQNRGGMVTSGSFMSERVAVEVCDVKGKASRCATLDIANLNGWGRDMNDPEVTMHDTRIENGLVAHSTALEAASVALALVRVVPTPFRSLADQVIRSASSVAANLSEGHGRFGRDRLNHWRIAYGSAKEVDTLLRLLVGAGVVDVARTETALDLFDQVRAMTWRLLHPKQ